MSRIHFSRQFPQHSRQIVKREAHNTNQIIQKPRTSQKHTTKTEFTQAIRLITNDDDDNECVK